MKKRSVRPHRFLTAAGVTVAAVAVGTAAIWTLDAPADVGQRPAPEALARESPEPGTGNGRSGAEESEGPADSEVTDPGDTDRTGQSPVPERLSSTDLDLSAPVERVGVDDGSQVEVPDDVARVGWYRFGPEPGADGSSVLVGHVDSADQGRGALWSLREAAVDDVVTVHLSDGTARDFRVVAREQIDKADLPAEELFAREGEPRLTLITCGGEFDAADSSYTANVVVTALPLDDT